MKKKGITLLIAVIGVALLTAACGMGNVDMGTKSSSASSSHTTAKQRAAASRKKAAAAKSASIEALGKQYKYGLPMGPSWLQVYEGSKATGVYLSPTAQSVVKLHENSHYQFRGELPWVGTLACSEKGIDSSVTKATLDNEDKYDYNLDDGFNLVDPTFTQLTDARPKVLAKRAFSDLKGFYQAVNDQNADELPSSSANLKSLWGGTDTVADSGALRTRTDIQALYFDEDALNVDPTSNAASTSTRVKVNAKWNDEGTGHIYPTNLYVQTYAKVKKTEVAKSSEGGVPNADYGKTKTAVIQYQVIYQLTKQDTWELTEIDEGSSSDYALDTSKGQWITEK